jgi:hypothetical protein
MDTFSTAQKPRRALNRAYSQSGLAAFPRLHALVRKGYCAQLGVDVDTDSIRLEHPRGASADAPSLLLYPDGLIIGIDNVRPLNKGEGDPDSIYVDTEGDGALFESFLSDIPKPTMWQAINAMSLWEMKMVIVLGLICGVFCWAAVAGLTRLVAAAKSYFW